MLMLLMLLLVAPITGLAAGEPGKPQGYDRVFEAIDAGDFDRALSIADSLRSACEETFGDEYQDYKRKVRRWL